MHRHLPQKPEPRYWVTGNYIFDYRDSKFGIGAMLQTFLVGDPKSDMPVVFYFKFDTEALGKFTGQLAVRRLREKRFNDSSTDFFPHNIYSCTLKHVVYLMPFGRTCSPRLMAAIRSP